jgi:signal transduction histidine kinase
MAIGFKILGVSHQQERLSELERICLPLGVEFYKSYSGRDALGLQLAHEFGLAIIDETLPDMNWTNLIKGLHPEDKKYYLPVILLGETSGKYPNMHQASGFDFISTTLDPSLVVQKVRIFRDLYLDRRRLLEIVSQFEENNRILARYTIQMETASQIGHQATSNLELSDMLARCTKLIRSRFKHYFVGVWLYQPAKRCLVLSACSQSEGRIQAGFNLPVDTKPSLIAKVWRTRRTYIANQAESDPLFLPDPDLAQTKAEIVLPLRFAGGILGVLDIHSSETGVFDPDEVMALELMADQLGIAIRNASLYAEVRQLNENLEGLVNKRTAELNNAYQVLEKMDKNKSDFITVAAHELRTPLTIIRGYAEMLRRGLSDSQQPLIEGILKGQERLLEVVNSMLDMARIEAEILGTHKESIRLQDVIEYLVSGFQEALVERHLTIEIGAIEDLPFLEADQELMKKLFRQLLNNAIKYTPDYGKIQVLGESFEEGGVTYIHLQVVDSGIGIDPANQESIFEKFFQIGDVQMHSSGTTKFKGGGPGLGLSIARGIVTAHSGRIWVESPGYDEEKLPGSVFHVLLPAQS